MSLWILPMEHPYKIVFQKKSFCLGSRFYNQNNNPKLDRTNG